MTTDQQSFPIVGVGASAGGVEAFEGFFRGMPSDTGMAFVIVTHMPRGYETTLPEILSRFTDMPVRNARNGEAVVPDHIYVCPSDHTVTVVQGRLHLEARVSDQQRKPIDVFLGSLAEERGEDAIGVILSGGGSDGALGIKAIKERGGLTLAQGTDGTGPRQSSMPETAIATGLIDLILPVEDMSDRLVEFARSAKHDGESAYWAQPEDPIEAKRIIAEILYKQIGHDFSGYKEKTFMRRVRRRMQIAQVGDLGSYIERLRREPDEVTLLFRDLLIGVTNFFRDKEAFEGLEQLVIPRLFEKAGAADTVRVWVPGCASGEEVYSIAILMREHMDTLRGPPKVQLFATDIDEPALAVARGGRYPHALMESVRPDRLERFFIKDDSSYTVIKEVRDLCIFSAHSVIRDPPFSRIDLISCRNLLIYLGTEFQAKVIPIFHFALKPSGYLFLGTSENISQHSDLFQRIDRKQRLFQRRDHVASPLQFPLFLAGGLRGATGGTDRRESISVGASLRKFADARVLEHFAPAHVVVNRDGDIVHFSARTGKYLEAAPGMPSRQLLAAARRGLRLDLRSAMQESMQTRHTVVREPVSVEIDDRIQLIRLVVEPLGGSESDPLFLVLFSDLGTPHAPSEVVANRGGHGDATAEQLDRELRDTRERLQATVEEYETALEELKAANEEMVSVNEELQSTNEELETSKEELQSVNEELHTVNTELNNKIEELDRANADLRNLFESTEIATVFLDKDLVIRSFTPAVTSIFSLISSDRGRPLTDIVNHVVAPDLKREMQTVLEHGRPIERQVARTDGNCHYMMRVLPYRARNNLVDGVIVTFFDVSKMVAAERQQRTLISELNHRVRNMLAVVSAVAKQTLTKTASPQEFVDAFLGRIQSMAGSYTLVSRENWSEVPLADVVKTKLNAMGADERVGFKGPDISLKPRAVLAFGLVLHELATNATKYGALSNGTGRIDVTWKIEAASAPCLDVRWHETNGPRVKKPAKNGFGTTLIAQEMESLGGRAEISYEPSGLRATLAVPLQETNAKLSNVN